MREKLLHERVDRHPFGVGVEIKENSVAKDGGRDRSHVVACGMLATVDRGSGFGR